MPTSTSRIHPSTDLDRMPPRATYLAASQHHYGRAARIKGAQRRMAEAYHWAKWAE